MPPVGYPQLSTAQLPARVVVVPRWLKGKGMDVGAMRIVSPSLVQHPKTTSAVAKLESRFACLALLHTKNKSQLSQ